MELDHLALLNPPGLYFLEWQHPLELLPGLILHTYTQTHTHMERHGVITSHVNRLIFRGRAFPHSAGDASEC